MSNFLYTVAIVLLILWALGFFLYNTGAAIHILILVAAIAVFVDITKTEKV
ncbi:MAG: lmo0937 family membrane protein [Flavobacterium sp. JAD_PAG50586_2]|nr:MAG: lmo0937 family membrane protein [Flavobacterium sp. JAD_PAG50586_2]